MNDGSCNACLTLAAGRGVGIGTRIRLRGGRLGVVDQIDHDTEGVRVLVHSDDGRETVLLRLETVAARRLPGREAA